MGKVIAVANQKGGVGKTTSTVSLGACVGDKGKKVLIIDMDPQGNTTSGIGIDKDKLMATSYEMVLGDTTVEERLIEMPDYKVDIIPSSMELAGAEVELIGIDRREDLLDDKISQIKDYYDFILIDCPPSLNI